jgi:uncharacterized protein YndB with AHSA1/START domain
MPTTHSATVTLPSDTQILITREFDAPAHLVWRAYTEPELIAQWWPGGHGEMTSTEVDLRVGGMWRYVMNASAGFEVAVHGEYKEIVTNARLVTTEVFEGIEGAEALDVVTFEAVDGRTILKMLVEHSDKEGRDAHLNSGMESGMQEGMDLLEQIAIGLGAE